MQTAETHKTKYICKKKNYHAKPSRKKNPTNITTQSLINSATAEAIIIPISAISLSNTHTHAHTHTYTHTPRSRDPAINTK